MESPIIPRDQVAGQLSVSTSMLLRYEGYGLVRSLRVGNVEGYGPAEVRRLWTIITFHRDLGINLAGIEVILRFRDQMDLIREQLGHLAVALRKTLDDEGEAHGRT